MTTRTSSSSKHRKNSNKGRARLKFGGGYKGLALAICNGNTFKARRLFGV